MKKFVAYTLIMLLVTFLVGCTITHQFGPFMGRVIDAGTGEPIEGAVVLIVFFIESSSVGGSVYSFADAVESLTDEKGEFSIDSKRVNLFKMMASWSDDHKIIVFKPGYGVYPGHRKAYSSWNHKQALIIPEDDYITYYLPKLKTLKERKENLSDVIPPSGSIENVKIPKFRRLENIERVHVGLKPSKEWR